MQNGPEFYEVGHGLKIDTVYVKDDLNIIDIYFSTRVLLFVKFMTGSKLLAIYRDIMRLK